MTTYNTGNPVGSTEVKDLYDNAQNLDNLVNGPAFQYSDRLGVLRKSWSGMEQDFNQLLLNSQFELPPLEYVDGTPLDVDRPTQVIERSGQLYRVLLPASFPLTLSGTWATDEPLLTAMSDESLRTQLANNANTSLGAGIVGYRGRTVHERLDDEVNIMDFGAAGDGVTNDAPAFAAAFAASPSGSVFFPAGSYNLAAMTPVSGLCRIRSNGSANITGFNWTDLSAPRQDSEVTVSASDAFFQASGITFTSTGSTVPGLTIKNQSQPNVIRSASIYDCVFRGNTGLVIDNAQGCTVSNCNFIHNVYGIKNLSATNNSFVSCNFYAPIIGVYVNTSADDTTARLGGENLKFVSCMWIDGVTAIHCTNHNYLWLTSCLIDYFNCGVYLAGSKYTRFENTYIGAHNNNKTAMPGYIAPTQLGAVYATGVSAANRSSGLECANCEFMAYGPSSVAPVRLVGNGFAFTGVEEVEFIGCRFASISSTNTMTELLNVNTALDMVMTGNVFYSPGNNNVTAPWRFANLQGGRFLIRDNNFSNVFNSSVVTIPPASGNAGNEVYESARVTLPTNGTSGTNAVAYTYKNQYKNIPRAIAMAKSGPIATELLNVANAGQDTAQVFLRAYNTTGAAMSAGGNVVVDVIIMGE